MKRKDPICPVVAVGVIIRDEDRVVLVRRAQEPSKGRWSFPGGVVNLGETLANAAKREALEETGLTVEHLSTTLSASLFYLARDL